MRKDAEVPKKLRVLALHGFRTSATIFEKQISRWDPAIHELVEIEVIKLNEKLTADGGAVATSSKKTNAEVWCNDGPFPARGESDVKDIFEGPYFEWMQHSKNWTESYNYEESIAYVLEYMEKNGPFDGVLGFSQGAVQAGCIIACQQKERVVQGKSAADLPHIRFFISISGGYLRDPGIADVYMGSPMDVPTLHLFGAKDSTREWSAGFLQCWKDPVVIEHPSGHTVPRLDEKATATAVRFLKTFFNTSSGSGEWEVIVGDKSSEEESPLKKQPSVQPVATLTSL